MSDGSTPPPPGPTRPLTSGASMDATPRIRPQHLFAIGVLALLALVLYAAREGLGPFVLGGLIAYLLIPVVQLVEGRMPPRLAPGLRHVIAVLLTFALTVVATAVLLSLLLKPMMEQTSDVLLRLPVYWNQLLDDYSSFGAWYSDNVPASTQAWIEEHIRDIGRSVIAAVLNLVGFLFNATGGAISGLSTLVMVPLFMVYFMIDQPNIAARLRHQLPASWGEDAAAIYRILDRVVGSYTRGVVVEALIVGVITGTGYWLIGVELALPLGVIAFAGEIIPILGPWIAFFISFPVVLVTQPDRAIPAIALFGVIQLLEGWLIAPKIQSDSVDFSASTTLIVLAIGGALGGGFGMLISLPVAAVGRALVVYAARRMSGASPAEAGTDLLPGERVPRGAPASAALAVDAVSSASTAR